MDEVIVIKTGRLKCKIDREGRVMTNFQPWEVYLFLSGTKTDISKSLYLWVFRCKRVETFNEGLYKVI